MISDSLGGHTVQSTATGTTTEADSTTGKYCSGIIATGTAKPANDLKLKYIENKLIYKVTLFEKPYTWKLIKIMEAYWNFTNISISI